MSSYLKKQWSWDITIVQNGENIQDVNIFLWEYDTTVPITLQSDANGQVSTLVQEAVYTIDNTDDITVQDKTPHTISICKYGIKTKDLLLKFEAARNDTFYVDNNPYIAEADVDTVADYTGISIDHSTGKITITEDHTINEVYDYCQYDLTVNPQKNYTKGIFTTSDGKNYNLVYDLTIDGCTFSGEGSYIDMSNNTKELVNDGITDIKIKDINGLPIIFKFTLAPAITNYEYRIYKIDNIGSLAGAEALQGEESATMSSVVYTYSYNDTDIPIAVQIISQPDNDYEESITYYTLSNVDQNITINLNEDKNN